MKKKPNEKRRRGRPSVVNWKKVTPSCWKHKTDTEIAVEHDTSQPNVRFQRKKLIDQGQEFAQYVKGVNANRKAKLISNQPYRSHNGGAYSQGIKLTPGLKLKKNT